MRDSLTLANPHDPLLEAAGVPRLPAVVRPAAASRQRHPWPRKHVVRFLFPLHGSLQNRDCLRPKINNPFVPVVGGFVGVFKVENPQVAADFLEVANSQPKQLTGPGARMPERIHDVLAL